MDFELFDPNLATDDEWREVHAYWVMSSRHDRPERTPPTLDAMTSRFRDEVSERSTDLLWLAREQGRIVASARYDISHEDADHYVRIAFSTISVHPQHRQRGIGTELLRLLTAQAGEHGKDRISLAAIRGGTPAEAWLARLGFEPTRRVVSHRLELAATDAALWDLPMPAGYRLVSWGTAVPEEFLDPYCRYLATSWGSPDDCFSPSAVRAHEAQAALDGSDQLVLAVLTGADGEIVATKTARIERAARLVAHPGPSKMTLDHGGSRLSRALEAAILRTLATERPEVAEAAITGPSFYLPEELSAYEREMRRMAGLGYRTEEYLDLWAEVEPLTVILDGDHRTHRA
ncbi:hypothetical protein CFP65_0191 [Kitasatospora sp. MMS16-BH015]|uniref:GNAT family N-acetyltransferase n=1 Tax=Kitasatospora sp. MMS16-BH015 TaxID=2018025 RepID=UPI000CA3D3BF|nr:GNAT family N-acetyltransferase [Kitasatospora sp. MMS16-BH015]AUG75172.1 hypothetical protein CFP65_0191 [Kitasatospora sp. MMS16-BH015]